MIPPCWKSFFGSLSHQWTTYTLDKKFSLVNFLIHVIENRYRKPSSVIPPMMVMQSLKFVADRLFLIRQKNYWK